MNVKQRLAIERAIIKHLIETMAAHGWTLHHVFDGEEDVHVSSVDAALDAVFSVDDSTLVFENDRHRRHWVLLILGNGYDVISDYSYDESFEAAMAVSTAYVESLENGATL